MLTMRRVFISSDHAGVELRLLIKKYLENMGYHVEDFGCDPHNTSAVDYPDCVREVVLNVSMGNGIGVLICGTGIGMSIAANRNTKIRAALCSTVTLSRLAREHNDANILCLGARYLDPDRAKSILHTFISTEFSGGRHLERVKKLSIIP
ncbi:ribose 5-phosphate isomerase B [Anaplasma bovis]|uniref:ribose 5-phosphate isomerase B n=1 Tax=Anaplasma bovis TaxID=186733 RepID=UPI002FEFB5C1